jgi:hypothetical protein
VDDWARPVLGTACHEAASFASIILLNKEGAMTHWRKPLPAFRFNAFAVWTIGMWIVLATLVLVARHGYI